MNGRIMKEINGCHLNINKFAFMYDQKYIAKEPCDLKYISFFKKDAIKKGNASAVGLGSMVTFQKKGNGVLVNFPLRNEIENFLMIER